MSDWAGDAPDDPKTILENYITHVASSAGAGNLPNAVFASGRVLNMHLGEGAYDPNVLYLLERDGETVTIEEWKG